MKNTIKKSKRISMISLLLASIMSFSAFAFVGCKDGTYSNFDEPAISVTGKTHEVSVGTTPYKMVENGATNYKLLVTPEDKKGYGEAIVEFQNIFKLSTGITVQIEEDNGVGYSDNATYISLGETSAFKNSGIIADYQTLGMQGFQIQTKGKSIFVVGQTYGILFGVYELLHQLVDYDTYTTFGPYVKRDLKEILLPDLRIKEVPDIEYRIPVMGAQFNSKTLTHRMRYLQTGEVILPGGQAHNILEWIVPYETHKTTHPEWFSNDQTQLCYTAHGDTDAYEMMVDEAVKNIKQVLDRNPKQWAMSITQMDIGTWCECETCQGLEDHYGTNAASQIMFVNDVATDVKEWLDTEKGGREVQFMFFAYHMAENAPAKQNEDQGELEVERQRFRLDCAYL